MTISMENYYVSSDSGQDKTDWQSVWRTTFSVLTLNKIKLQMTIIMEDYCFSSEMNKIKLDDNYQYGELLQF